MSVGNAASDATEAKPSLGHSLNAGRPPGPVVRGPGHPVNGLRGRAHAIALVCLAYLDWQEVCQVEDPPVGRLLVPLLLRLPQTLLGHRVGGDEGVKAEQGGEA